MANPGRNEGFHVLEDFVCEAIHEPSVPLANPASQGRNEGMTVVEELVFDASRAKKTEENNQARLPRLLICAIFYDRARELDKRLPVGLDELDLAEQGREALVRAVSRYFMARGLDFMRPSEARSTFLIDLAILMADLARPNSVFVGEARQTANEVAGRLLRYAGWIPVQSALSEWKEHTMAIDPAGSHAAKAYLALLRRYWGWVGPPLATSSDEAQVAAAIVIPESILGSLTSRCT